MTTPLNVLLVEDSEDDALLLIRKLKKSGFDLSWDRVEDATAMTKALKDHQWDLILSDYAMPNFDGLQALEIYKQTRLEIPFIIVSGTVGEDVAVSAMKEGAHDYLMKDKLDRLAPAIKRELRESQIRRERKDNISLLKEREEFLTAIIENIPHTIFIKDAKTLTFVRINKAGEELLGMPREALVGKSDYDFFSKAKADKLVNSDRRVLKNRVLVDIPNDAIQTKSKGKRMLHTKKIPIMNELGVPQFLLFMSEDITDKLSSEKKEKDLINQLRQAQKLESLGTLAGGIAHDFNNILSAIIGYSELIRTDSKKGSEVEESVKEVLQASSRAADLVQQILTFSRHTESKFLEVEMKSIVQEALKLLRSSIPSSIEIKSYLESGAVMADPTQIHQVVMNLCTNAYHAMRDNGGLLKVTLSACDLDEQSALFIPDLSAGPVMKLTVEDTGHGIDAQKQERIFDPYYTTKEKGEGTGLGLAVVHGIVKNHLGAILVESTPGKGSVFSVYFPKVKGASDDLYMKEKKALPTGTERVLFVDDEPLIGDVSKILLVKLGYHVTTTSDSQEALDLFTSDPAKFDLVITDMTMPKLTGDKLALEIKRIRADIPIILCTGYSEKMSKERSEEIGVAEFIYKPLVYEQLANVVRLVLDQAKETF